MKFEIELRKTSYFTYCIEADSLEEAKKIDPLDFEQMGDEIGGKDYDPYIFSIKEVD